MEPKRRNNAGAVSFSQEDKASFCPACLSLIFVRFAIFFLSPKYADKKRKDPIQAH